MDGVMINAADFYKWVKIFKLVSSSGPIPPAYVPPGGIFMPTITPAGGIASIGFGRAKYFGNLNGTNGVITAVVNFRALADASNNLMQAQVTNPILANFSNAAQAQITSFTIIKTSSINAVGGIGHGCFHDLYAESGAGVRLIFEGAQPSVEYTINAAWTYQIQAP